MKTRLHFVAAAIAVLATNAASGQSAPRFTLEVEGGPLWQTRNDVRIPNNASATAFSLVDLAGRGPWTAWRAYVTWSIDDRRELRLLAAPLSVTETGVPDQLILFGGASFAPSLPTTVTYKFNSFRLTYRWRFHHGTRWTWRVGGTAKVRDAKIALRQGVTAAEKIDVGFVPLLHIAGDARLAGPWRFTVDTDALGGGPGRAIDASLKLAYDAGDRWRFAAGYRTVEGGADVDPVFAFAWLHSAVLSVAKRF